MKSVIKKIINILYLTYMYRVEKLKSLVDYKHNITNRKIIYNIRFNYS